MTYYLTELQEFSIKSITYSQFQPFQSSMMTVYLLENSSPHKLRREEEHSLVSYAMAKE
jgi:hypothetical protein